MSLRKTAGRVDFNAVFENINFIAMIVVVKPVTVRVDNCLTHCFFLVRLYFS